tara:strand:+ start:286 stop:1338 length:1053 start_codon:yes stop_codon:yes gene_type:complete
MAYITFQPHDYFNTLLYTGNNTDNRAITGVGFRPDWCWFKLRNTDQQHELFDIVRGANKTIEADSTAAETTNTNRLKSFDSDGFTLGTSTAVNKNYNYVCWNWRAANAQGSSNTDGSINTTYTSANTTSGFSISKYNGNGSNGATIGHGLGVAPDLVIIKRTDTTSNWIFSNRKLGFNKFLYLNTTDAETTNSGPFNDTAPSSSVITLGTWNDVNNSSGTYVAYAFAEKKGFSKFGTYTGTGNANGAFIYTGFKPAMVMVRKSSGSGENWNMFDNKRGGDGAIRKVLYANTIDDEENKTGGMDFLANGIKMRGTDGAFNAAATYVFMAFAEEPLVASNGDPATAGSPIIG